MSGRSPSKPGGSQPTDDELDDVTDAVGIPRRSPSRPAGRQDRWPEQLDPTDPRLADAIRRLQETRSGAWDEDSLPDLKGSDPVAQEEITGTLSRYLENALASSLADLEREPDDEHTEPDPVERAAVERAPEPTEPDLPGRVLAHLQADDEPQWPPPGSEPPAPSRAARPKPPAPEPPPEPSMPELPDLPDLPEGGWDEEPVLSTRFDDDLGPVDEFTLSIHPELVQQAVAEVEAERHDAGRREPARASEAPTAPDPSPEVSRLRKLVDDDRPGPGDGTVPTLRDREERTVAIPEDEPERTVTGFAGDTRPDSPQPRRAPPPPESVAERTMDILAAIADMPPGDDESIGGSLEQLDELMSIADAPPEAEETIGASLERIDELLSIADAPPGGEQTIGASLERLDDVKRKLQRKRHQLQQAHDRIRSGPPRPTARPPRRVGEPGPLVDEASLGGSLEPVDEVPDVVMPGEVADPRPGHLHTPRPPPRRPARPRAVRPSDELTQALPDAYQPRASEELTQALPDRYQPKGRGRGEAPFDEKTQALPDAYLPFEENYAPSPSGSQGRAAPPVDSTSDFMRRETYQPQRKSATPPPARPRGPTPPPAPPKVAPPPEFLEEEDDPYKEPILAWAATLFGFILFGGFAVLFLIAVLMIF